MLGIHDYWAFVLTGILLNLTPGQDTFFILGRSLAGGPQTDADERVLQQYADKAAHYEEQEIEMRLSRGSHRSSVRAR